MRNLFSRLLIMPLSLLLFISCRSAQKQDQEYWRVHHEYEQRKPTVIAVLPMDNMTFDQESSRILREEVYKRLLAGGYKKIDEVEVDAAMERLGIQVAGQLAAISFERLGRELNCDAVIMGQVDQSGTQHQVVYDAVAVSCSLSLIDCRTGDELWHAEQWRAAHRQIQADPINMFLNVIAHRTISREQMLAWLVQEMMKTLPPGPVEIVVGNLLEGANEVIAESE